MKGNELDVLDQYEIDVNSTRKIRGAILCDTNQGPFLLKQLTFSEKRVPELHELCDNLAKQGYSDTDQIIRTREGALISEGEVDEKYILKKWFYGRECDSKREIDILDAVRNLACLHRVMTYPETEVGCQREELNNEFLRHNRELKKVRSFMRSKSTKSEFEIQFLKHFDDMYDWAECACDRLGHLPYYEMLEECKKQGTVVHGDYNYHNLLIMQGRIATTGFERFYIGLQMDDFYYFLRKTMEKNQWNVNLGHRILEQYHRVLPLSDDELRYLAVCIAYPEKYWKLANSYNRSGKVWISVKTMEKLEMAIRQTEEKKQFLKVLFSYSQ